MSILGHGQGGSDISSLLDAFNELHRLYRLEGRQYPPERWRVGCYPRCYPSGLDAASAADQYPTGNPLASYQHHPCENSQNLARPAVPIPLSQGEAGDRQGLALPAPSPNP